MTTTTRHLQGSVAYHPGLRASLVRAARNGLRLADLWYERHLQRRALAELNPELLRDIGVSEGDAQREAAKPFWQA